MNIKDKITIGIVILLLVIFGIIINSNIVLGLDTITWGGVSIDDYGDLTRLANDNLNNFINAEASTLIGLKFATSDQDGPYNGEQTVTWYRSGACFYHGQSTGDGAKNKVVNIIDFGFDTSDTSDTSPYMKIMYLNNRYGSYIRI